MKLYVLGAIAALLMTMPLSWKAAAEPCPINSTPSPNFLDPEGDWDKDGLKNSEDPCCFIASAPGDTTVAMCEEADQNTNASARDFNGNGIPADKEGECCVTFNNGRCWQTNQDNCLSVSNGVSVLCDNLLWYGGAASPCTGFDDCICFTVGDYDTDGHSIEDIGPFDNCPERSTKDNDQSNSEPDEQDAWGDACDFCPNVKEEADSCDPTGQQCTPPGKCLLFAFESDEGVEVKHLCSFSPDKDGDKAGDACDKCPENAEKVEPGLCGCDKLDIDVDSDGEPNCKDACPDDPYKTDPGPCGCGMSDADKDTDSVPDCADKCPDDPNKFLPGNEGCGKPEKKPGDSDGDEIQDSVDNCPSEYNPEQEDSNEDGIGDKCTELADKYTGAFACDCSGPGAIARTDSLIVLLLSVFVG